MIKKIACYFLAVAVFSSCVGKKGRDKLIIAKAISEKYYDFYNSSETDSILKITRFENSDKVLNHLGLLHKKYGLVHSKECVGTKIIRRYINGKSEIEVFISYKVEYDSSIFTKERFDYHFNTKDSNKIYSLNVSNWNEEDDE